MTRQKCVITLEELQASLFSPVDNTGNVREWPSEEILAYYLVQRIQGVDDISRLPRRVIELGAGKSGLVGLVSASILKAKGVQDCEVIITDGNEKCVETLNKTLALNTEALG